MDKAITSREVIEGKLLTALEGGGVVACLFSESDLVLLIQALGYSGEPQADELMKGFEQLLSEGFRNG